MIPPKKIKNIARALLLPQKQDLVRASFNQSELAVWDLLCHPAGVGGLYEIPGSGKDQNRCLDMLQALNTGHFGLSTGHGNSAGDMLSRLETMALMAADIPLAAVRGQIASAIDILVHLGRLRDRSRRVLEITEVLGYADGEIRLNPLYRFELSITPSAEVEGVCDHGKNEV